MWSTRLFAGNLTSWSHFTLAPILQRNYCHPLLQTQNLRLRGPVTSTRTMQTSEGAAIGPQISPEASTSPSLPTAWLQCHWSVTSKAARAHRHWAEEVGTGYRSGVLAQFSFNHTEASLQLSPWGACPSFEGIFSFLISWSLWVGFFLNHLSKDCGRTNHRNISKQKSKHLTSNTIHTLHSTLSLGVICSWNKFHSEICY